MPTPCPGCNKMCSLKGDDPEVESVEYSDGEVTATINLSLKSACCGEEMRTHQFEFSKTVETPDGVLTDVDVEEGDCTVDDVQVKGPKGKRKGFKVNLTFTVKGTVMDDPGGEGEGKPFSIDGDMSDEVAQADMEEA